MIAAGKAARLPIPLFRCEKLLPLHALRKDGAFSPSVAFTPAEAQAGRNSFFCLVMDLDSQPGFLAVGFFFFFFFLPSPSLLALAR